MFKKLLFFLCLLPAIAFCSSEGTHLITHFWKDVQYKHIHSISKLMTRDYQCLAPEGARTKSQDLAILRDMTINRFRIYNVVEKKHHNRLDIIYDTEFVDGATTSLYHQLHVYEKRDGEWRLFVTSFMPFGLQ